MSALAAIHVAKKALGLDEDTYRALLSRTTGKSSAADMDEAEREQVLAELRRQGFKGRSTPAKRPVTGRYVKMFQAFWTSGYNLGLIPNNTDAALNAFVVGQTKIAHMSWVKAPAQARKVIEAFKAWFARDAGVVWPKNADDGRSRQLAVLDAQLRLLGEPPRDFPAEADLVAEMKRLGARIRKGKRT
ncbi:MAG: regulatory protein GemA [Methylobacterium mesophilicum]|nr:regulatory protein GemA [Methylobacterium mesophilicum]